MGRDDTESAVEYLAVHQLYRRHRAVARRRIDEVRPGTARGAVAVIAWLATVVGLTLLGRRFLDADLGLLWLVVATSVMLPVAWWWPKRRRRRGAA